jgi:hypothetical protein
MYGYESHPNGIRDKSYVFALGPLTANGRPALAADRELIPSNHPDAPPLRPIGVSPDPGAFDRAVAAIAEHGGRD